LPVIMSVPFLLALVPLLAIAALLDLRQRRIPNWVAAAVGLLGGVALAATAPGALWQHALVALLMLVAGIAIWSRGWLGGGDVKLLAALSLWAGPDHVASLLLATTLAGGFLALGMVFAGRAGASPLILFLRLHAARLLPAAGPGISGTSSGSASSLPYGLAVACGGGWLVHLLLA
jgi:prepilin peptidase CpaA